MADLQPAIRQGEADAAAAQPSAVAAQAANLCGAPRAITNQAPFANQAQINAGLPAAVPGGNMPVFQAPARHNTPGQCCQCRSTLQELRWWVINSSNQELPPGWKCEIIDLTNDDSWQQRGNNNTSA